MTEIKKEIKPKLFYEVDGTKKEAYSILLKVFDYTLFSTSLTCYYELYDKDNTLINEGKNLTIPTPESWGEDDNVVVDYFFKAIGVETDNN